MLRAVAGFLGLPFLARALGYLILAATFVQAVYDGARSIANNTFKLTSLEGALVNLLGDKAAAFRASVEQAAPWLWHGLMQPLAPVPAVVIGLVLGTVLLWLGMPGREPVGYATRP